MLVFSTGCATYSEGSASNASSANGSVPQAPRRDQVLWSYRNAALAMRAGRFDQAKAELEDALARLGGIYGPDKAAASARRLFNEESKKNFIGEPYERVMAYYYRGILYWMDGEPDNARACFRTGQLLDSDAENKTYAGDYALLDYLDGLASVKLAADGSDAFARAQSHTCSTPLPPYAPRANVLFFVEFGNGPLKYAAGQFREQLRFREGYSAAKSAVVKVAGQALSAPAYDDLYFQATTRGGRVMDHILAGKAQFKAGTDSIGDAAIISGAVLASHQKRRSNADEIGAGLLLFGLASKLISGATNPTADTRCWENLPGQLSFAAAELPPGQHTATIEFLNAAGTPHRTKTATFTVQPGRDTVVFLSDH
jgi:tetratricopeptide (TPR) repeat protein